MLQPRKTNSILDRRLKNVRSLNYRSGMLYFGFYHTNLSLALLTTLILAMVPIEASQSTSHPYLVSPTPTLAAIASDGYNRKNVSRFHAHSRTGRINSRYILDYENEVFYRSASEKILEEARYNLATHVMSNGVELIIASEKGKPIGKVAVNSHPNSTTQQFYKPFTLAPSTLTNQMILTLPLVKQDTLNSPDNSFITKICLSTYTYRTTYVDKGSSKVVSKEMVISNSLTEERKDLHASNPLVREDTFSKVSIT
ncbi:uncharacterized protein LOC108040293 isoform X2 [Drosophila rhopaloa]|uniref:Uncharacterized protein n=1 Tax=Drosophila rhopaloa TaxID=1041015 RepID=A0ABM5JCR4_DRORH|nr:uncharacterized protein LOC108040293 isoform X2 [Drosophila rhopaloa]